MQVGTARTWDEIRDLFDNCNEVPYRQDWCVDNVWNMAGIELRVVWAFTRRSMAMLPLARSMDFISRRRPARRQSDEHRAYRSQLPESRAVQGCSRRSVARGIQRQGLRSPRSAEDGRQTEQQQSSALAHSACRHQAATGNLRRRCEVHTRRDGRKAGRAGDVLSQQPGDRSGDGAHLFLPTLSPPMCSRRSSSNR